MTSDTFTAFSGISATILIAVLVEGKARERSESETEKEARRSWLVLGVVANGMGLILPLVALVIGNEGAVDPLSWFFVALITAGMLPLLRGTQGILCKEGKLTRYGWIATILVFVSSALFAALSLSY